MSELQYGVIPDLEKRLPTPASDAETQRNDLLRNRVTDEEIAEVVSKWTGIPVSRSMLEGERDKLLRMEEALHGRVIGQDRSRRVRSPMRFAGRAPGSPIPSAPNGSFLFLGPTGVGKTELTAKRWRNSCSTPKTRWSASTCRNTWKNTRLPGSSAHRPGYVGYEEGGYLTETVRRKPYSVLLLDEVEKGASGRVQHPAAGSRRRPFNRWPRAYRRLSATPSSS